MIPQDRDVAFLLNRQARAYHTNPRSKLPPTPIRYLVGIPFGRPRLDKRKPIFPQTFSTSSSLQ